jgi:uncharacterized protein
MGKVLVLVVVALVAWIVLRAWLRRPGRSGAAAAEDMVACAHCAVNLPRSEAVKAQGRFFCSEEHRSLVARDGGRRG